MASKPPKLTPEQLVEHQKGVFIETLAEAGSVKKATQAAGVPGYMPYNWRRDDAEFAASWQLAFERSSERLHDVAVDRAVNGVQEPLTFQGHKTGESITKYNDNLLTKVLEVTHPRWRTKSAVEVSGPGGGSIQLDVEFIRKRAFDTLAAAVRFAAGGGTQPGKVE